MNRGKSTVLFFVSVSALILTLACGSLIGLAWLLTRNDCDIVVHSPVFSPNRMAIAVLKDEVCTGLARRSNFEIELGHSNLDLRGVFAQDGPTPPDFHWANNSDFVIDLNSSSTVLLSDSVWNWVRIAYFIPANLSRRAVVAEIEAYRARMIPLIEQGKVEISGGDVPGNLAQLDEIIRSQVQEYDSFAKWLLSKNVRIRPDNHANH